MSNWQKFFFLSLENKKNILHFEWKFSKNISILGHLRLSLFYICFLSTKLQKKHPTHMHKSSLVFCTNSFWDLWWKGSNMQFVTAS